MSQTVLTIPTHFSITNLEIENNFNDQTSLLTQENKCLEAQVQQLRYLLLQYQLTNQKMNEKEQENTILKDSVTTLELNVNCLSEIIEIQGFELSRQDSVVTDYQNELDDHRNKMDSLVAGLEESSFSKCKKCHKRAPAVTGAKNKVLGCVLCTTEKTVLSIDDDEVEQASIQNKKIKKLPKNKNPKKNKRQVE